MLVDFQNYGISLLKSSAVSEPVFSVKPGTYRHTLGQNQWSPAIDYLITKIWLGYIGTRLIVCVWEGQRQDHGLLTTATAVLVLVESHIYHHVTVLWAYNWQKGETRVHVQIVLRNTVDEGERAKNLNGEETQMV